MVFFKKPRIKAGLREKCTADRANNIREAYIMSSPGSTPKKRFHLAATVEAVLDYPLGIVGLFLRVSELRDSLFPCWHEHAERKGRYFSMEQAVWSIKKISCPTPGRVRAMQTCESVGQPPPPPKCMFRGLQRLLELSGGKALPGKNPDTQDAGLDGPLVWSILALVISM